MNAIVHNEGTRLYRSGTHAIFLLLSLRALVDAPAPSSSAFRGADGAPASENRSENPAASVIILHLRDGAHRLYSSRCWYRTHGGSSTQLAEHSR
jgi:hypothetical protein